MMDGFWGLRIPIESASWPLTNKVSRMKSRLRKTYFIFTAAKIIATIRLGFTGAKSFQHQTGREIGRPGTTQLFV